MSLKSPALVGRFFTTVTGVSPECLVFCTFSELLNRLYVLTTDAVLSMSSYRILTLILRMDNTH